MRLCNASLQCVFACHNEKIPESGLAHFALSTARAFQELGKTRNGLGGISY